MNTIRFSSAVSVDKGLIRSNNEDNFYYGGKFLTAENRDDSNTFSVAHSDDIQVFGVFDGMGGEALGEEASFVAAEAVGKCHKNLMSDKADINASICKSVQDANDTICRKIMENGGKRIGATYSVLVIDKDSASIFNVGDSRIYMFRNGELRQISVDDTMSQQLINIGILTPEQAKTHKDRHKLTQHLGIFPEEMIIEPHIMQNIEIKKGDKFLLCSDGLTDMLTDEEICAILGSNKSCTELTKDLVSAALKNGGKDNVTTLVVSADSEKAVPPAASVTSATPAKVKKSGFWSKKVIIPLCVLVALGIGVGAYALITNILDNNAGVVSDESDEEDKPDIAFVNASNKIKLGSEGVFEVEVDSDDEEAVIEFKSSDEKVISVDEKGAYKAHSAGKATIEAVCDDKSCSLEVEVYIPVEDIKVKENLKLKVGESKTIDYTVKPKDSSAVIVFSSENESVATVSKKGEVTAVSEGEAKIILSSDDFKTEVKVTVQPAKNNSPKASNPPKDSINPISPGKGDKKNEPPVKNDEAVEKEVEPDGEKREESDVDEEDKNEKSDKPSVGDILDKIIKK